ncbi:hypothetical protein [Mycobacterium sp. MUNTM1]
MSNTHDGSVPSIKYFGTTWYERGWPYWRRRLWLILFGLVLLLAVLGGITALFFGLFALVKSWQCRSVVAVAAAIPILWSCYSTYVKLRRSPEDRAAHRPMSFSPQRPENLRAGGAAGVATGVFASGGSGLAGGLLAVGSLFIVGQALGCVAITRGKYVNEEEWRLARPYGLEK